MFDRYAKLIDEMNKFEKEENVYQDFHTHHLQMEIEKINLDEINLLNIIEKYF